MNAIKKIEPFIENVIIGLLFVLIGLHIQDEPRNKIVGFIGIIAILWGGFKILLGLIIYGISLWFLLFKPESFVNINRKRIVKRVLKRMQKDKELGDLRKAKDRLHGLICSYPNYLKIKFELAEIYLLEKDFVNAGRYLFLKAKQDKEERFYVKEFEKSLGENPFQILRSISEPSKIDLEFVKRSKSRISGLINNVKIESEKKSWIVKEYAYRLHELNKPFYQRFYRDQRDLLIHVLILIALLSLNEIINK